MSLDTSAGESEDSSQGTPLESLFGSDSESSAERASSADENDSKQVDKDEPSQKLPADNSSPDPKAKDEKAAAEKKAADEKPTAKPDGKSAEQEEDTPEQKAAREAEEAKKKWENDENPYFKRYRDTSTNWQREHQENLQLKSAVTQMQQEMVTLRKIADGTYDPEVDAPKPVSHETVAEKALNVGKVLASRNAAVAQYGAEDVAQRLTEFTSLFDGNELINKLVVDSEAPVYEAFRILDRYKFESKYGSSPADWHKNIRAEAEKELREKIKAEVTEELMGRADKKNNTPRGLSSSRGSNGLKSGQNSKGSGPKPLSDLFS